MPSDPPQEQPITRDVLFDIELAVPLAAHRIQARRITMLPNHPGGLHVHNGPVVGNVVEGSVIFQVDGEPEQVLNPGDVFYEPEGTRIARFDAGPDGVTFLAYFPLRAGQEPAIDFPDDRPAS
jgi:quercetin dioxygenase-like cupin family protein